MKNGAIRPDLRHKFTFWVGCPPTQNYRLVWKKAKMVSFTRHEYGNKRTYICFDPIYELLEIMNPRIFHLDIVDIRLKAHFCTLFQVYYYLGVSFKSKM